jgi:ribonuclease R
MNSIPTKQAILDWITEHPTKAAKRDIAKAFGIKGAARIDLKRILKELESEGHLAQRVKTYRDPDKLPPISVLEVLSPDADGDLFARPMEWTGAGPEPRILMVQNAGDAALGSGERILAKLQAVKHEDHAYLARLIRKIGSNPEKILGIFRANAEGGRVVPIDKGAGKEWLVNSGQSNGAEDGELVEAEQSGPKGRMGLPRARIVAVLGDPTAPRAVSLIAIHQHNIPDAFPDDVVAMADNAKPVELGRREDMRDVPLVTIDPSDARDHDDAIWAEFDTDSANVGGFILWVAIADVAHYVTPGSALDKEARLRGNSTYFPDRVVPMLPDLLSGDLCSLHEGVPRPCIAVRMKIDAKGAKLSHEFTRGLMRSAASLNYAEVQQARDGAPNEACAPLMDSVINPIYEAYAALKLARADRQPLELDLPERKIVLGDDGKVSSVAVAERLDAHKLIEEFMVLANVSAAEELFFKNRPLLYRVHEEPSDEKLEALREVALGSGLNLAKGQVLHTSHLNRLLSQAAGTDHSELINISTLRSMTQAYYHPQNYGHFGLALRSYAHFTSPIRRYADLIVHRALISAHDWGNDGLSPDDIQMLDETAKQISDTERRSMVAERDTNDRYLAAYLSERIGTEMTGHISGIQSFGAFIKLDETGADGLAPVRNMGAEFFHYDADTQTLMGSDTGLKLSIGQKVVVRIADAVPVTGGLELEILALDGMQMPRGNRRARGKPASRKHARSKAKRDSIKKKVSRKRH